MQKIISSRSNSNVRHAKNLVSFVSYRNKCKEFIIEGRRLCLSAVDSGVEICQCYLTEEAFKKHKNSLERILKNSQKIYWVKDFLLEFMSDTKKAQGIICVCKMLDKDRIKRKTNSIEMDFKGSTGNFIILENIQDPANLGTIIRTACAFGISEVILSNDCCDIYSPKVLRGSMGSVFELPFNVCEDVCDFALKMKNKGVLVCAAVAEKNNSITINDVDKSRAKAVAIGNEGRGLTSDMIEISEIKFTVPTSNKVESLNAAVAASIIMWEMTKRRAP
ncbi:MAG: RNA methyltransferase [Oscillospiraceae bacterium]|jgi:TrmH family RNA methyltransferase|nr:RNA methyltransferase [Oscillospiraceae bacterium]